MRVPLPSWRSEATPLFLSSRLVELPPALPAATAAVLSSAAKSPACAAAAAPGGSGVGGQAIPAVPESGTRTAPTTEDGAAGVATGPRAEGRRGEMAVEEVAGADTRARGWVGEAS